MDGPSVMYRMRPVNKVPDKIDLPTCMYSMRKILNSTIYHSTCDNSEILNKIVDKKPLPELSELEARWERILCQLHQLTSEVNSIKEKISVIAMSKNSTASSFSDIDFDKLKVFDGAVINANPSKPPYSLFFLSKVCNAFSISSHLHSSVKTVSDELLRLCETESNKCSINIKLIWKGDLMDAELIVNPIKQIAIRGEVNILRYLCQVGLGFLQYPAKSIEATIELDNVLDLSHRLQHTQDSREISNTYKNLAAAIQRKEYFGHDRFNICDLAVWSVVKQNGSEGLMPNLMKWFNKMESHLDC